MTLVHTFPLLRPLALSLGCMLIALAPSAPGAPEQTIRIACIGTGITNGNELTQQDAECYPAQLQQLMGNRYAVKNFGSSNACLLRSGRFPYLLQPECAAALNFKPNVVFIELGTNDCDVRGFHDIDSLAAGCDELITRFGALATRPRIILLIPPPLYSRDTTRFSPHVMTQFILPALQASAFSSGVELVNLQSYMLGYAGFFTDGVHPSSRGAAMIARRLQNVVAMDESTDFNFFGEDPIPSIRTNYHGFECFDFSFGRRDAKIVIPKRVAKDQPWVWRGRFWGHEPQTEIALLERGFHLVYCDVSELYGNAEAISLWDKFYTFLVKRGLARKACMIGFSRGGIYVYRWATTYPDRVACVYADAPVLDVKSWPGGKGKGGGNPVEWERFKQDFGLTSEAEALGFTGNPLDMAEKIGTLGFPMLHVCGDKDPVVPIEENTDLFEKRVLAAGGQIKVIRKPGVGHHPHSLPNPEPIVDFILRATQQR
jgi:lysophospholipase L1-like esterase/pimeloyl-ACP methyl ester carboxylesterase